MSYAMRPRPAGFPTILAFALLLIGPAASAAVLHVGKHATCYGELPCYATIQAAIDAAGSGDTVRVQAGTYAERVLVSGKTSFALEGDARWAPASAVIAPAGPVSEAECAVGSAALEVGSSSAVTLRRLGVHGYSGSGVRLRGLAEGNTGVRVIGLRIAGNGQEGCGAGIRIEDGNPGTLLAHNLVHGNHNDGVLLVKAPPADPAAPQYLWANTVFGNARHGLLVLGFDRPLLWNNVVANNGVAPALGPGFGIARDLAGSSASLTGAELVLEHNLLCGNGDGEIAPAPLEVPVASGNLTPTGDEGSGYTASPGCATPRKVFGNGPIAPSIPGSPDDDFFLAEYGPGVNAGTAAPASWPFPAALLNEDFYQPLRVRPADAHIDGTYAYDIGALEWGLSRKRIGRPDELRDRVVP